MNYSLSMANEKSIYCFILVFCNKNVRIVDNKSSKFTHLKFYEQIIIAPLEIGNTLSKGLEKIAYLEDTQLCIL